MATETLRLLVYPEGDLLLGQCLEHDACYRGRNREDLYRRFKLAILADSDGEGDFFALPPAPDHFLEQWESATEPPYRFEMSTVPVAVESRTVPLVAA